MSLKPLTVPITFVLAVPIGLFNGLSLPDSLLVAAWFTVLVLPVLPMHRSVAPMADGIVLLGMLLWGTRVVPGSSRADAAEVGWWTGIWVVCLIAIGLAMLQSWFEARRKKKVSAR